MNFFSISNDCDVWNRHKGQSCKRRKIQNCSFGPQTCDNVAEDFKSARSNGRFVIMDAGLNKSHLQFLIRQLLRDLHAFIKHAKQLFNDNFDSTRAHSPVDNAMVPTVKQMEFVGHAIDAYLRHFALSDAILELLETSAKIFKNSFQQTAASTNEFFDASCRASSDPAADIRSSISPTSWTADTFSKMVV